VLGERHMRATTAWVGLAVGFATAIRVAWAAAPTELPTGSVGACARDIDPAERRAHGDERRSVLATVASCLVLKVGSRDEGPEALGLASLALRVAVEGESIALSAARAGAVIAARGGEQSVEVGPDATSFCITVPANELPVAMWLTRATLLLRFQVRRPKVASSTSCAKRVGGTFKRIPTRPHGPSSSS